jgi:hypothetical protein
MQQVRYLNKTITENERQNFSRWWYEQFQHYGTRVNYYTNGYTLSTHNFIYGEDPTSVYVNSGSVVMVTDITNDALMLSKFGLVADCDMTAMIHISAFYTTFGGGREPKAGDLIELAEFGGFGDRPGGRGAPIYEVTERDDQNFNLRTNPLMGHYVWVLKCKRWEYSSEPGTHAEPLNTQIDDGAAYGRMPGGSNPDETVQPYPDTANTEGKKIYDYSQTDISSPYGYYGLDSNGN